MRTSDDDPHSVDLMARDKCLVLLGEARELLSSPRSRSAAPGEAALCAVECAYELLACYSTAGQCSRDDRIAGLRTAIAAARAAATATAMAIRDEMGPESVGVARRWVS